jgi:hypothetical protein
LQGPRHTAVRGDGDRGAHRVAGTVAGTVAANSAGTIEVLNKAIVGFPELAQNLSQAVHQVPISEVRLCKGQLQCTNASREAGEAHPIVFSMRARLE